MEVAKLFISLGIKGQDKTAAALSNTGRGLKGLASLSFEAKAAILGAMYAVQQLFDKSGKVGTNLSNFNATVGVSTKTLQQYQYAARQVGVSNEETESSFKSLQSAMTKTYLGEGAPKFFGRVASVTGGFTSGDVEKFMQNPELLLQKLQDYAKKEKNIGIRNEALKSFGLGEGTIAALTKGAFNQQSLSRAPTYSDKEIGALNRANIAWSNLGAKIQMAVGHFNAMHGEQIVGYFSKLVGWGLKFADILVKVVNKLGVFKILDKVFSSAGKGIVTLIDNFQRLVGLMGDFAKSSDIFKTLGNSFESISRNSQSLLSFFGRIGDELIKVTANSEVFEHLGQIFTSFGHISGKVLEIFLKIGSALLDIATKAGLFENLASIISNLLTGLEKILSVISPLLDILGGGEDAEKAKGKVLPALKEAGSFAVDFFKGFAPGEEPALNAGAFQKPDVQNSVAQGSTQNVTVNQNLHFGNNIKDPQEVADHVQRSYNGAMRQLPAQKK